MMIFDFVTDVKHSNMWELRHRKDKEMQQTW